MRKKYLHPRVESGSFYWTVSSTRVSSYKLGIAPENRQAVGHDVETLYFL